MQLLAGIFIALGVTIITTYFALNGLLLVSVGILIIGIGTALLRSALTGPAIERTATQEINSDRSRTLRLVPGVPTFSVRTVFLVALVVLLLIFVSPLAPMSVASYRGVDWSVASDIGQSYGAISAILAGLALLGVVGSVAMQSRQTKIQAQYSARQMHFEITREAWQNPEFLETLGNFSRWERKNLRQHSFINIYLMYLRMGVQSGEVSLSELEEIATEIFATEPGKRYWRQAEKYLAIHGDRDIFEALARSSRRADSEIHFHAADPELAGRRAASYLIAGTAASLTVALSVSTWWRKSRSRR